MSFLSDLFLGSGGTIDARSMTTLTPEQQQALQQMLARLSQPTNLTSGEQSSLTALEQRSQAMSVPSPERRAAGQTVTSLMDFEGQTGDASAFFTNRVQNPLLDSFQREILPQISRSFGGNDFFSSERQAAEGLARQDLLNALAGAKSEVELNQFNQARDRALTASGQVPALTQADNQQSETLIRILEALGLQSNRQLENDKILAQLLGIQGIENVVTAQPGNAGVLSTIASGIASGVGDYLGNSAGNSLTDMLGRVFGGRSGSVGANTEGASVATGATGVGNNASVPAAVGAGSVGNIGAATGVLPVSDLLTGMGAAGVGTTAVGAGTVGSGIGSSLVGLGQGATLAGANAAGALPIADLLAGVGSSSVAPVATGAGAAGGAASGAGAAASGIGLGTAVPIVGALFAALSAINRSDNHTTSAGDRFIIGGRGGAMGEWIDNPSGNGSLIKVYPDPNSPGVPSYSRRQIQEAIANGAWWRDSAGTLHPGTDTGQFFIDPITGAKL